LVIAQTERPGLGMSTRCTAEGCHPLYDLMMNHDEYRRRWNELVAEVAESDDRVRTFRMDPLLCTDPEPAEPRSPSSCDDLIDGALLRPDGSHPQFGEDVAGRVWEALIAAGSR
jgi:hypothetical protein